MLYHYDILDNFLKLVFTFIWHWDLKTFSLSSFIRSKSYDKVRRIWLLLGWKLIARICCNWTNRSACLRKNTNNVEPKNENCRSISLIKHLILSLHSILFFGVKWHKVQLCCMIRVCMYNPGTVCIVRVTRWTWVRRWWRYDITWIPPCDHKRSIHHIARIIMYWV